jgi:hypothetical protein
LPDDEHKEVCESIREMAAALGISVDDKSKRPDESEDDSDDVREDFLDRMDNLHGGRYGYGVTMPRKRKEEPVIDPEEEAHSDQDSIDDTFNDLMEDIDL